MKKKSNFIILVLCCILILFSCQNQQVKTNAPKYRSAKLKLVEKNIDAMGEVSWNKSIYEETRDVQIPLLKGSEQVAASEYLESVYQRVLVRDADSLLNNACAHNHDLLAELVAEMSQYEKENKDCARVIQRKKTHDEILTFAKNAVGRQPVKSFKDNYDESYETKTREKANKYLASVTCEDIIKRLKNLNFVPRRRKYCEDIVNLYVAKDDWNIGDENILYSRMEIYTGNKSELDEKIKRFRIEKITPKVSSHVKKLQSMNCCTKTLQDAQQYYRTLPADARRINNFSSYLEAYEHLFSLNASSTVGELSTFLSNYGYLLSNEQMDLLKDIAQSFSTRSACLGELHNGESFERVSRM